MIIMMMTTTSRLELVSPHSLNANVLLQLSQATAEKMDMEPGLSDWHKKFDEYFGGPDDMIKLRKVSEG